MRAETKKKIKYMLVCLLAAAAGFLCAAFLYANQDQEIGPKNAEEVFSSEISGSEKYRTERQQLRSMQKAQLNEIIFSGDGDPDTIAAAQNRLLDIIRREEQENKLEGLLELRGFQDVVVSVHRDSVSILIRTDVITQQQSALIMDLVCRETGFLSGNIKIIPVN